MKIFIHNLLKDLVNDRILEKVYHETNRNTSINVTRYIFFGKDGNKNKYLPPTTIPPKNVPRETRDQIFLQLKEDL